MASTDHLLRENFKKGALSQVLLIRDTIMGLISRADVSAPRIAPRKRGQFSTGPFDAPADACCGPKNKAEPRVDNKTKLYSQEWQSQQHVHSATIRYNRSPITRYSKQRATQYNRTHAKRVQTTTSITMRSRELVNQGYYRLKSSSNVFSSKFLEQSLKPFLQGNTDSVQRWLSFRCVRGFSSRKLSRRQMSALQKHTFSPVTRRPFTCCDCRTRLRPRAVGTHSSLACRTTLHPTGGKLS